jgi:hypothetical protein
MTENTTTVELQVPVQHDGKTFEKLTFREAEVGDLIDAANGSNEMERLAAVMASCSGTPLTVIRKIKARDLKNIMKKVGDLVGNEF